MVPFRPSLLLPRRYNPSVWPPGAQAIVSQMHELTHLSHACAMEELGKSTDFGWVIIKATMKVPLRNGASGSECYLQLFGDGMRLAKWNRGDRT